MNSLKKKKKMGGFDIEEEPYLIHDNASDAKHLKISTWKF